MRQYTTQGIVLTRTDFGEADRIITFLTSDHGKVKAMAKGVRRSKAKLAGAVELFGVSDLTLIDGRGEIKTLISARLDRHYGNIVKDIDRTNLAYEFLQLLNKSTEDQPEKAYFDLLDHALGSLNDQAIPPELTSLWFKMQLLKLAGHSPNLKTDNQGSKLQLDRKYTFDHEKMCFSASSSGQYTPNEVKFLRISFSNSKPVTLSKIVGVQVIVKKLEPLVQAIFQSFLGY